MLAIALPMMLSHATTPLLGLVGAAAIGRLGEAHLLGAVALGAVIFDFLFWTFGSLRMATAGLTAQATGAGDQREVDRTLSRALTIAAVAGLALVLLQVPIASAAFRLAGASEAVTDALARYFSVRIWSAPFTLANYAILGSTLGRARTDLGLLLQVAINLTNIVLTATLVMGFGLGVTGAALGTVAAEIMRRRPRHPGPAAPRLEPLRDRSERRPRPRRDDAHACPQPRHHDPHDRPHRSPSRSSPRRAHGRATSRSPPTRCSTTCF